MVRGRYRVGVSKTKTKEKIMMKKKVMPLSCLMAAAMLAGCGTAAPAVPEETTAPAVETAEAAQETAPADAAESEAAAVEKTAGVWQVEPCYNFDEIVPLYSEWDHTAGKNAADGLYARGMVMSGVVGKMLLDDRHLWQRHRRQHLPQFGLPFDLHIVSSFNYQVMESSNSSSVGSRGSSCITVVM